MGPSVLGSRCEGFEWAVTARFGGLSACSSMLGFAAHIDGVGLSSSQQLVRCLAVRRGQTMARLSRVCGFAAADSVSSRQQLRGASIRLVRRPV
eukprot:NODE_6063_length_532_cov_99.268344.p4 GENE.NODE_6063_length_532_cov_99.268344~~NODE_6063_length_532_cov_99.268344.p4  ORF type:complete len:94 (+),score=6.47 NODE_6063_length_532_cov_99.268344:3-284(+)